jgi:HAD superfamily hydrolase (TIGR01484 family)
MSEADGKPPARSADAPISMQSLQGLTAAASGPSVTMQPIGELPPALCRALEGVVFDVDDTLTRDGKLEEEAYSALWKLREAGLVLVAVTGRPLGFAELIARMWPVELAVGENGAGWVRVDEDGLHVGYHSGLAARDAEVAALAALRVHIQRQAPWAQLSDDHWARRCDLAFDIAERVQLAAAQIEQLRELIEAAGARCVVSSVHAHAALADYDKARGVVQACREALGRDLTAAPGRWLFVGDSGNDAAAFAYFPLTAAVANVTAHLARLPVAPRYVSLADRGRGFAEIAATVLERR